MKQKIRINESQLRDIIAESVKNVLNELDYKTYANAAKKRMQQYREHPENIELRDKYQKLNQMANKIFDNNYVGDMKYDRMGDKWKGQHSPSFNARFDSSKQDRMPYGAIYGYNKGGDKIFSTNKGTYHAGNGGITSPGRFFKDKEVADKYQKANDELWDYYNDNYEYIPGIGWRLKK